MTTEEASRSGAAEMARCYRLYRPSYPQVLLENLLARAEITPSDRLLDLACGTGRLTLALAPLFASVTAVDPGTEALAEAGAAAAERGTRNVTWQLGTAEGLDTTKGAFKLVTVGDAFHRFDQPLVLARAKEWLAPGGSIAVLRSFDTLIGSEPWHAFVNEAVTKWTGRDGAKLAAQPLAISVEQCEAALRQSGFQSIATFTFKVPHEWSIEAVIGNLFSTSYCAKHVLGQAADDFAADVTRVLSAYAPDGVLHETLSYSYTFGIRP